MRFTVLWVFLLLSPQLAVAESSSTDTRLDEVLALLRAQQTELDAQRSLITRQSERIDRLQAQLDDRSGDDALAQSKPAKTGALITQAITAEAEQTDSSAVIDADVLAEQLAVAKTTIEESADAQEDDPTRAIMDSLPGAMRLPGTNAVMRWGGFVKTSFVQSFDPLAITDRFITGTIPVSDAVGSEQESDLSVSQSRLSFDLREPTDIGLLRGYIEADFAEDNDTFRLRHAFSQRGDVLVGKTWSGFVDRTASPEEIDFEGLNGRINVRQAQVRFQPKIGERYEMAVSLEDPAPRVTNGDGVSKFPDAVVSGRVNFGEDIHVRVAALLRQVRAQWEQPPFTTEKEIGWGVSVSGRVDSKRWDRRDKLLFQLNAGKGYGRYVNDLRSVGDFDGIFSPDGELELIDVLSGYISGQHWWGPTMRSTVTFGFVVLDNPGFVPDDFYQRTFRTSANLIWSPTPRINLGGELLWGRRKTEDGSSGEAMQFQFATKYLF
jgi:hypothetical protein